MASNYKRFTILLADSDPDEYYLLRDALEENGYPGRLAYVSDAEELMTHLRSGQVRPSIILMEPNELGRNGVNPLAELRKDPDLQHIPVVVMTTISEPDDVGRSYALGARSHIGKPLTFEDQVRVVGTLLSYWMEAVILPEQPCPVQGRAPAPRPATLEPGVAV